MCPKSQFLYPKLTFVKVIEWGKRVRVPRPAKCTKNKVIFSNRYIHIPTTSKYIPWKNAKTMKIRRPRPSPRPGRRLGPPQVWNFSFLAFQGQTTSRKPSPGMRHPPVQISRHLDMKIICFGQVSFPAENLVFQGQSSRSRISVVAVQVIDLMKTAGPVLCLPCGHQTREGACAGFTCARPSTRALNVRGSFHQVPGRQRSSIAACPLPAHSPVLLGHSSLPFASLQTLKTPKTPKTLHRRCGTAPPATTLTILQLLHGFLPTAATKPSGRQPLLLQGCSLPFACTVSVPALQPALCLHIALSCYGIRACRLPAFKRLKPLKPLKPSTGGVEPRHLPPPLQSSNCCMASSRQLPPSPLAVSLCCSRVAACPLPAHRLPSFTPLKPLKPSLAAASTKFLAVSVPALQPALCLHIALSC